MNTGTTIFLTLLIVVGLVCDAMLNDWQASLFLARKFLDLLSWAAFWR